MLNLKIGSTYMGYAPKTEIAPGCIIDEKTVVFKVLEKPQTVTVFDGKGDGATEALQEHLSDENWLAVVNIETGKNGWLYAPAYPIITPLEQA